MWNILNPAITNLTDSAEKTNDDAEKKNSTYYWCQKSLPRRIIAFCSRMMHLVVFGGRNVQVTHFPSKGLAPGMTWVLSLPTRKCTRSLKVCRLLCTEDICVSWMMSRGSGEPTHREVVWQVACRQQSGSMQSTRPSDKVKQVTHPLIKQQPGHLTKETKHIYLSHWDVIHFDCCFNTWLEPCYIWLILENISTPRALLVVLNL